MSLQSKGEVKFEKSINAKKETDVLSTHLVGDDVRTAAALIIPDMQASIIIYSILTGGGVPLLV